MIEEAGEGAALGGGALAHLDACPPCRTALDESVWLRHLINELGRVEAPPDFDFRLRARLSKQANERRPLRLILHPAFGLAAAACLFVVILIAAQRGYGPTTDERAARPAADNEAETGIGSKQFEMSPSSSGLSEMAGAVVVEHYSRPEAPLKVEADERASKVQTRHGRGRHRRVPAGGVREESDAVFASHTSRVHTILRTDEEPSSASTRPLAIPVRGPDESLRVILRDERGGTRFLPVRSISFGAQELVARERTAQKVSQADQEGVW